MFFAHTHLIISCHVITKTLFFKVSERLNLYRLAFHKNNDKKVSILRFCFMAQGHALFFDTIIISLKSIKFFNSILNWVQLILYELYYYMIIKF